jgi:nicotinamide-nucleotide adenylyltransferase
MRGLVVGRFQPYHLGHHRVLTDQVRDLDHLTVAVGSSLKSHRPENPFTAGERLEMIQGSFRQADVDDVTVVPIPDMHRNAVWVAHVESQVPPFDVLLTNNELPKRLFSEAGYDVEPLPFHDRDTYEGTRIRELMREGGDWASLVPDPVADVIRDVDGPERLRDVAEGEGPGEQR